MRSKVVVYKIKNIHIYNIYLKKLTSIILNNLITSYILSMLYFRFIIFNLLRVLKKT